MQLVKLTSKQDGKPVYVNPTKVVSVDSDPKDLENGARLVLDGGFGRLVTESVDDVASKLKKGK